MEVYFSGTIERIIFENPSNFYRILLLDIEDTDAEDFGDFEIIVTGTMADVIEGEDYTFWGQIVQHSKYGEQLQISRYERAKPTSKGLVKYFSSSHFKGIGLKTAQKIVDSYGDNTIDEILEHPEKLEGISGLSAKNREAFVSTLRLNYGTEMVLAKLANYGIPNKLAFQIQDFYKEETLDIVENYPYQLVEDIKGLGFTIADQLAAELGIESQAPERFRAGLVHSLFQGCMETDVGSKTVGVAISDPLGFTAQGLEIIQINEDQGQFGFDRIKELVDIYKVERFVVGLPKNMNNTSGPRVEASQAYGAKLEELFGLPVDYQDERLTTVAAERMLIEQADISRNKRKKVIDKLAAQLILQNYLDRKF